MTFWNTSFKTNGSASTTNRKPSVEESKSRYVRLPVVVVVVVAVAVVVTCCWSLLQDTISYSCKSAYYSFKSKQIKGESKNKNLPF